jgi:hypothetical protein
MMEFDVDIRGFQSFTQEAVKNLDADQQLKVLRALALTFVGKVVPRTPVDTGQARGGWSAMGGTSVLAKGPGAALGRQQSDYKESTAGGQASIEITNGVPHIVYLELGSSQQAPSGFVRLTLREMVPAFRDTTMREVEKELRLANIKSRRATGLRQGLGSRDYGTRANVMRK